MEIMYIKLNPNVSKNKCWIIKLLTRKEKNNNKMKREKKLRFELRGHSQLIICRIMNKRINKNNNINLIKYSNDHNLQNPLANSSRLNQLR